MRHEDAMKQVARLSARKGFQNLPPEAVPELVETLRSCCRDAQHAEAVITTWNRTNEWVPQPSELWSLSQEFPEPRREFAACQRCTGSGFMTSRFIRTRRPGQEKPTYDRLEWAEGEDARKQWDALQDGQDIVETAGHCVCPKGQHMRAEVLKAEAKQADAVEKAVERRISSKAAWEARKS